MTIKASSFAHLLHFRHIHIALGWLLLLAAALKGHALATGPVVETNLLSSRWFLILLVEFELFLGVWLLAGFYPRLARSIALACFSVFIVFAGIQVLSGEASCGCLGKVRVSPWLAFSFDLVALLALC